LNDGFRQQRERGAWQRVARRPASRVPLIAFIYLAAIVPAGPAPGAV